MRSTAGPVRVREGYREGCGKEGVALPVILFLLLCLTLLAHGTLLLALQEYRASRAFLHATRAEMAARSAVLQPLDGVSLPPIFESDPLPILVRRRDLGDDLERVLKIRWLSNEFFFLEGEGRSRGWPGSARVAAVGWRMDPVTRMRAFAAGMEVGGEVLASDPTRISSSGFLDPPLGWDPSDCEPYRDDLDFLFPLGTIRAVAPLPWISGAAIGAQQIPGLGLLAGDRLLRLKEGGEVGGAERPLAPPGSGCPGSGGPRVLVSSGSVTLSGDHWCGLLVIQGDLRLEGEGRFQGLFLVAGTLTVGSGWLVQGMGRLGGDLLLSGGGRMEAVACPAMRVLEEVPALRIPFLLQDASEMRIW